MKQGYVPRILVSGPPGSYGLNESDAAIRWAVQQGYPAEWFIAVPHDATSTRAEAAVMLNVHAAAPHPQLSAGDQQLSHRPRAPHLPAAPSAKCGGGPDLRVVAAARQILRAGSWWQSREGRKTAFMEWTKTVTGALRDLAMWESLGTVRNYLWRYRWGMALGGLCLVCKDLAQAVQPLMIRGAVDSFRNGDVFVRFALYLVGLAILKGFFQYWMRVIIIGISRDTEFDLRNDLFAHLVKLSPDFYARTRTGDIMARATNDLNAVRMMLGPGVMYWFETSLTFVLAIAIMMRVDWRMALFAILPAPAVSLAVIVFGRIIHRRFEKIQAMFSDISSRVQENLAGVRMIRAFVQEKAEMRRFEELNRGYIAQNIKLVRMQGLFQPLLEALIGMTFLVVLWFGGGQVLAGKISVGSLIMFNTYMGMLVWPMIALGWVVNLTQRGSASLKRINEILREQPLIAAPPDATPLGEVRGEIEFRGVTVDYGSGPALDGHRPADSRRHHAGRGRPHRIRQEHAGGAGAAPARPDRGRGPARWPRPAPSRPRGAAPPDRLRPAGDVPLQRDHRREHRLRRGARDRRADPPRRRDGRSGRRYREASRQGYETMVGERGITLSGGQKQRTAIARALMRDPKILILDDALSSVDTLTEERILTHLAGVMRGRTVILISHRVSTVQQADRIVVLERGQIVEQGTHAELCRPAAITPRSVKSRCSKKSWKRFERQWCHSSPRGSVASTASTNRSRVNASALGDSTTPKYWPLKKLILPGCACHFWAASKAPANWLGM